MSPGSGRQDLETISTEDVIRLLLVMAVLRLSFYLFLFKIGIRSVLALESPDDKIDYSTCDFTNAKTLEAKSKFCTRVLHPGKTLKIKCPTIESDTKTAAFPKTLTNIYMMNVLESGYIILKEETTEKTYPWLTRTEDTIKYGVFDPKFPVKGDVYIVCQDPKAKADVKLSLVHGTVRVILGFPAAKKFEDSTEPDVTKPISEKTPEIDHVSLASGVGTTIYKCPKADGIKYRLLPEKPGYVYYKIPDTVKLLEQPQGHIGHAIPINGLEITKTEDSVKIVRGEETKIAYGMNPQVFFLCVPLNEDSDGELNSSMWNKKYKPVVVEYSPEHNIGAIRLCGSGYNSFDESGTYIEDVDCHYTFGGVKPKAAEEVVDRAEVPSGHVLGVTVDGDVPVGLICPADEFNSDGPKCYSTPDGRIAKKSTIIDLFSESKEYEANSLWAIDINIWTKINQQYYGKVVCLCYGANDEVISKLELSNVNSVRSFALNGLLAFTLLFLLL